MTPTALPAPPAMAFVLAVSSLATLSACASVPLSGVDDLFNCTTGEQCAADALVPASDDDTVWGRVTATASATLWSFLRQLNKQLHSQVVGGAMVLAISGSIIGAVTYVLRYALRWVRSHFWSTVRITDHTQASWLFQFVNDTLPVLSQHEEVELKLSIKSQSHNRRTEDDPALLTPDAPESLPRLQPAANSKPVWFRHNRRWVSMRVVRPGSRGNHPFSAPETYVELKSFSRGTAWAVALLTAAYDHYLSKTKALTKIILPRQQSAGMLRWNPPRTRPSRPFDTVITAQGHHILEDVRTFLADATWYYSRGIPYRRSFLLYGPPGTGKTSFITALAGELKLTIAVLNLSDPNMSDSALLELLSAAPTPSIVLLEDVDAAFRHDDGDAAGSTAGGTGPTLSLPPHAAAAAAAAAAADATDVGNVVRPPRGVHARNRATAAAGLTFSGLLNALDGVSGQEGKVVFMTTNHKDQLDEALIRPGRVDVQVEFRRASPSTARRLFVRFYRGVEPAEQLDELGRVFGDAVPDDTFSMAHLQSFLMKYRRDPARAAKLASEVPDSLSSAAAEPFMGTPKVARMPSLSPPVGVGVGVGEQREG